MPDYYGCTEHGGALWILLEYLEGPDLRDFTPEMADACAAAITPIMNAYWQEEPQFRDKPGRRFARYWERIQKRSACLAGEPELRQAYAKFLSRQLTCPRTLCNGDFLQYNGIFREGKVYIIDWAFGGRMPYALDIARLIAHGSENRAAFPFYMTEGHRRRFVRQVYQGLAWKPDWEQYLLDIRLALLNESLEFMEWNLTHPEEERDAAFDFYAAQAKKLAEEILHQ